MHKFLASFAAFAMVAGAASVANAQQPSPRPQVRGDQASAREEMRAGRNMPIGEIERRIIRRMNGAEYLGFEYDRAAGAYRLKFIENGRVIWVDVDAQTSRVLRVSR